MNAARRAGSTLLAVIVALVLIESLVAGTLLVVTHELAATRAYRATLHARLAAESALAAAIHAWPRDDAAALAPLVRATVPLEPRLLGGTTRLSAVLERLDSETYLLRALGSAAEPDTATAAAAALIRTTPRAPIRALAPAALAIAGPATVETGATIEGELVPPHGTDCAHGFHDADRLAIAAPAALIADPASFDVAPGAVLTGSVFADPATDTDPLVALRALLGNDLVGLADRVETGAVLAFPMDDGAACDRNADGNWGDPDRPAAPCARYAPLIFAPEDLILAAGSGHGILVAAGDLTLAPATRFVGLVLVAGALDLQPGASIVGGVRIGSNTRASRIAGSVRYDGCAIARALALAPALAMPTVHPVRGRLPAW